MGNIIKKISIIILILVIGIVVTNHSYAVGEAFSAADDFLGKRKSSVSYNR